jgi:predicted HTH domain antitoxin
LRLTNVLEGFIQIANQGILSYRVQERVWVNRCLEKGAIMAKTVIDISDDKLSELEPYKDRLGELLLLGLSQIKIQEVLLLYQRGLLSFGRAAELAGLSEQEMIRQARAFGVVPRWSEKMAEEEAA